MMDETRVRAMQCAYITTRSPYFLFHYQQEVKKIIKKIIYYKLSKTGVRYSSDKMDEVSHDASIRFIEQYLKNMDYICVQFSSRLNHEALFALYNKRVRKIDDNETTLYDNTEVQKNTQESTDWVIEDIMCDTEYWRNVLMDCYRATSFKKFLITISQYVSVQWITDHIKRLKKLYKNTRRL